MSKVKIAVLVSGGGTNLQALINSINDNVIKNGEISLVISNKSDAYALTRAKENNIKTEIVLRKDFETKELFENKILQILSENNIELIVLAGFLVVLSEKFVRTYKDRIINVHPSLIPSFCGDGFYGLNVHKKVLEYGVKITGATVHFVNEITDGGKIIMQKAVNVLDDDTPEILQKRVMEEAEWVILPLSVEKVCKELLNK